jgi:hypothetical protein
VKRYWPDLGFILTLPCKDDFIQVLDYAVSLQCCFEAPNMAESVVFLVQADFITGHVFYVDGK